MSERKYRPAQWQVEIVWRCPECGQKDSTPSDFAAPKCCGDDMEEWEESYPGNMGEWEEQRDPDGEWRSRRR